MPDSPITLHAGKFLRLLKQGRWEYVERIKAAGAVHIIAVTPAQELLLLEQYRPPVGQKIIELPAGIVGDEAEYEDETPEAAALRELIEETGYKGQRAETLFTGPSSAGLTNERVTMIQVSDLQQVGPGGGNETEDIRVHPVPLNEIEDWLARRVADGWLIDHKVYAALYFLRDRLP